MTTEGQQKTREEMTQKEKEEAEMQELLKEFHDSKNKEAVAEKAKAALPPMERQRSAPLWDHMLNPRENGSIDPLNLANRLENGEINYDEAVEEAQKYYKEEQKKKGGRKKRKSRRKRRKTKRKTKKRRRRKKRKTKKRYRNQRGCKR